MFFNHIAKSAQELAQIFKDLNQLVIEQGTIVDRIDYNMDQAVVKVKEGLQQVVKAEEYKKSNRPGFIIFVLIVIIKGFDCEFCPRATRWRKTNVF